MKTIALIIIPAFMMFSCNKNEQAGYPADPKEEVREVQGLTDAVRDSAQSTQDNTFRYVEGDRIIKIINGDMLPLSLEEEFTNSNQHYIIKIKNFRGGEISGRVIPTDDLMNIRFNQIKRADGGYDGPFGREISYAAGEPGEMWLVIGKSNMASGNVTGPFVVELR
ncbi:hypothetical protein [Chryseobacterium sp. MFBS3-17]|uniref:hypothetical protein n=1 Tax=Chryseobacterium sp. MFBS3-17 TaxID=2886689 RepID=UPI001D0E74D3|nr:hypothetical protein [Chryseobacterium sp. MFBS3-17]MCC2589610.1 hypothetical protein [Chryseobacterium sp. MFBS3-17]